MKVMRVYGGRHVINELVNEGYQDVLLDDLADVFGGFRAGQIFGETVGLANKPGFVAMTAAFFLGAFLTHKAMQRR
ncbi:hypothetical protein [Brevundimonas sp.]|uniref:hypothetical protein n=1 Tax=Brevundimonas sp. TaxID=1871086 RepID=UPI0025878FF3|nr:hypothetical protein [Brevundimonas sp.]